MRGDALGCLLMISTGMVPYYALLAPWCRYRYWLSIALYICTTTTTTGMAT